MSTLLFFMICKAISAVQVGVIYNTSLVISSSNATISVSSCGECVCAMLNPTGNVSILSLNCLISGTGTVDCELFSASTYLSVSSYRMKNTSNSTFYFRQLPSILQSETTTTSNGVGVTSTPSDETELPTTTMESKCTGLQWNTTAIVVASRGRGTNQVMSPQAVFIPPGSDVIYITDTSNNRVLKWTPGVPNAAVVAGGQGAGSNATQLNTPTAIHVDKDGTMFVADRMNYRVQVFTNGSSFGRTIHGNQTTHTPDDLYGDMFGLSVDLVGNVYISEYNLHRVLKLAPNSTNATLAAGNGTQGNSVYQLNVPTGIYADPHTGTLYIANQNAHCIVRWVPGDLSSTTVAGTCGLPGSNATLLTKPKGLTFDKYGNMYVADGLNPSSSRIIMFCVNSKAGIPLITSGLDSPQTIAFDSNLNLYVSDKGSNRILKYNLL